LDRVPAIAVTSNLKWAQAPGDVLLPSAATGLEKDSVATVSLVIAIDKQQLTECVGKISSRQLDLVLSGIDVVLGR
jgi:mRNA interferase MazF